VVHGRLKDLKIQQDEQGWSFTSQHVCTGCVDDYALRAAIGVAEEATATCDFCGSAPGAELDALLEVFVKGLFTEYGDADSEGVYYDGREGGYQWGTTWDTWDLVGEFEDVLVGDGLLDAVREAVHERTWVEANFATHGGTKRSTPAGNASAKQSSTRPGTSSGCATMRTRRRCAGLVRSRPVASLTSLAT
jgi:hypothetical protein